MEVNQKPDTIRIYIEEQVAEKAQLLLQRTLSDEDYVNLIAAQAGDLVIVTQHPDPPPG